MRCFEVPRKCFEVFYEVFGKRFVWFPLGFHVFEVFCPVWVLYNIKRGWDTPPGAHRAAPRTEALVPLPRLTLYRVPLCQTVTRGNTRCCPSVAAYCYVRMQQTWSVMLQDCLAHLFVVHCRTRMQETPNLIADRFLAHLFVLHCLVQAETKCSGKLGGSCSVEQSVSL